MSPPNARMMETDRQMMARTLALAGRGEGRVEPNPMVGCVIVRRGRIIGEGYHRRFGGPHAEINALRACHESPRGATAYVSLEPCSHRGKTPPCTRALIEARLARVVIPLHDPNPLVSGKGIRQLRVAGIRVDVGTLAEEAAERLAPFATRILLNRPFVIAKWAQSLDGKLATGGGDSKWISCDASRRLVHRLRARVDAIVVGAGTVLADDPQLTAREAPLRRRSMRIVLDARLRTPERCRLVRTAATVPTLIFTAHGKATSPKARRLEKQGVEIVVVGVQGGRLSIRTVLSKLYDRGATNILVEGGPTLLSSFLRADLVDEAWVFTAPILIGGETALSVSIGRGGKRIADALRPRHVEVRRIGPDVLHRLRLTPLPGER